jgi:hypothetical protein
VDVHNSNSTVNRECTEFFPFHFCFHDEVWEHQDPHQHQVSKHFPPTLPSTLDVSTSTGSWCTHALPKVYGAEQARCTVSTRVKYELLAYAYEGDEVVLTTKLEVRIYDTVDGCPPPIHITDFPSEYTITQDKRLHTFWSRSGRRLTIATAEPRPLQVRQGVKVHLAAVPLRFALRKDPKRPKSPPSTLSIRISSLLKAQTFISLGEMNTLPTVGLTKHSPYLAVVPRYSKAYDRKLKIREWKSIQIGDEGSKESVWMCDTVIWLPVCEQSCLTPTFFTPYVSRRYSLSLQMEAKGADGKASFHLNVPLQVVYPTDFGTDAPSYETATRPDTPVSELDDEEDDVRDVDRLPVYVR